MEKDLDKLRELINTLKPQERKRLFELAGLTPKEKKLKKPKSSHSPITIPSQIITKITCLHCGSLSQHIYSPRKVAILLEPGPPNRLLEIFKQSKDIVITQHTEARHCDMCREYICKLSREELEKGYVELLTSWECKILKKEGREKKEKERSQAEMKNIIACKYTETPPLHPIILNGVAFNYWQNVKTGELRKYNQVSKLWEEVKKENVLQLQQEKKRKKEKVESS